MKRAAQIIITIVVFFVLLLPYRQYDHQGDDVFETQATPSSKVIPTPTEIVYNTLPPMMLPLLRPTPTPEPNEETETKEPGEAILELRKQYENDEIIGYLSIAGTSIDYPVMQTDNNTFYLDNNIYKNESTSGWIFMDCENDIEREDKNTVIYGHNMKTDIMFHSLRYYTSEDFFNSHRYIVFNTLYDEQVWEVFSFYEANTSFRYIQVIFPTPESFNDLVIEMKERSLYDTGVTVTEDDRILTLSTCSGKSNVSRYVLNAKMLKPEEIPEGILKR